MGTPATYTFTDSRHGVAAKFYCHYDGYPDGAAAKILSAALHQNRRGGMAEMFIRANDDAEFASRDMGEEFRWFVDGRHIEGQRRVRSTENHDRWVSVFSGGLVAFINRYNGLHEQTACWFDGSVATADVLRARIIDRLDYACTATRNGWTGNASGSVNDAWRALEVLEEAYGADDFTARANAAVDYFDDLHSKAFGWVSHHGTEDAAFKAWQVAFRNRGMAAA